MRKREAQRTLYGRLHTFVTSIYDKDQHFSLLENVLQLLHRVYPSLMQDNSA